MSTNTEQLTAAGVSIWLDDLSRSRIDSGSLAELITTHNVSGVTTNPTIFQNAIGGPDDHLYDPQIAALAERGASVDEAIFEMTTDDVRDAADILRPVFEATGGVDGRVSIEVSPDLAHDTEATVAQAKELWAAVDRPNIHIKIPATRAGLPAITRTLAAGICVNVTLIFSLDRYAEVIDAFLDGIEQAQAAGHDISTLHSVASFFVSRVDTEVDKRLDADGRPEAAKLRGKAGVANARLAYELYEKTFRGERAAALVAAGAKPQRPLWASTGVKDPAYPDTLYVSELVVRDTVNTMPEKTLDAFADHGEVTGDTVSGRGAEGQQVIDELEAQGISYDEVVEKLEVEGLQKFDDSWAELLETVRAELHRN